MKYCPLCEKDIEDDDYELHMAKHMEADYDLGEDAKDILREIAQMEHIVEEGSPEKL